MVNQKWRVFLLSVQQMHKDIYISQNCLENCVTQHPRGKDHRSMDIKRFKARLSEFMSLDDEFWYEAFAKLQGLTQVFRQFRKQFDQKLADKKLLYCLNYDTKGQFLKIFKLANNDQFKKLTCEDIAMIENRFEKGRQPKESEIKAIIKEMINEEGQKLKQKINSILGGEGRSRERRNDRRPVQREKEYRETERERRPRRQREVQQVNHSFRDNGLQTIQVRDVENHDGNFNIIVKVLKIKKTFTLGEQSFRKIEFEGGDETGKAIFVVNSLKCVKDGVSLALSNAKIYSFHGTRQIQQNNRGSYVEQIKRDITVSDSYVLHQRRRKYNDKQTQKSETSSRAENYQNRNRPRRANRNEFEESIRTQPRQNRQDRKRDEYRRRQQQDEDVPRTRRNQHRGNRGERDRVTNRDRDYGDVRRNDRDYDRPRRAREDRKPQERNYNRYEESSENEEKFLIDGPKKEERNPRRPMDKKPSRKRQFSLSNESDKEPVIQKVEKKVSSKGIQAFEGKKKPTKIKDLQPGDADLNIIAEIINISNEVKVDKKCLFCKIGDETGTVWAELPQHHPEVKENVVLFLESVDADVHQKQSRLIIRLSDDSILHRTSLRIPNINLNIDMSEQTWESEDDEEEQDEEEEKEVKNSKGSSKKIEDPSIIEDF